MHANPEHNERVEEMVEEVRWLFWGETKGAENNGERGHMSAKEGECMCPAQIESVKRKMHVSGLKTACDIYWKNYMCVLQLSSQAGNVLT